ncbi:DUF6975 family protein [Sphingomonas solaris]|uniref:Uncharacterized protein n=1 Tax=Alterirhizorhabdus solaris TaxID=2529389 RepID=A0A558QYH1_9SPHN|nr:hypothetical protein [Sphingomonas solaris]TVV72206.1 hypothetical protein FOY91_15065 [Sphingomonas solaris]
MASRAADHDEDVAERLMALVQSDSSAGRAALTARPYYPGNETARNFADAANYLCLIHGRTPGVVDLAAAQYVPPAARDWLERSVSGFARERGYITRLAVTAGPQPSTPGHAASETTVLGQRHAAEVLAKSERNGCALGAAMALVLDWRALREVLDIAAIRFGIEPPPLTLPTVSETRAVAVAFAVTPATERAMLFGAEQIMIQHRALWDLLDARRQARQAH